LLLPQRGAAAVSPAHWSDGDHVIITSFHSGNQQGLSWVDLEATSATAATGLLAHDGEPPPPNWPTDYGQVAPTWSHDGKRIAYVSAKGYVDGRVEYGPADLYVIPYNDKKGGAATALAGAADPNWTETYPAFSPDDQWIAFNRVPGITRPYAEPTMEVLLVPSGGGTAIRLDANDPPACSGRKSPGVSNTWPRWSPRVETNKDRTYYWLVYSSTRYTTVPQLYLSPIVVSGGKVQSYPAVYFWNQLIDESNHTPAWDTFNIPPPPPAPPPPPPPPPPPQ
jgi:Tol biopolymer transport system component